MKSPMQVPIYKVPTRDPLASIRFMESNLAEIRDEMRRSNELHSYEMRRLSERYDNEMRRLSERYDNEMRQLYDSLVKNEAYCDYIKNVVKDSEHDDNAVFPGPSD